MSDFTFSPPCILTVKVNKRLLLSKPDEWFMSAYGTEVTQPEAKQFACTSGLIVRVCKVFASSEKSESIFITNSHAKRSGREHQTYKWTLSSRVFKRESDETTSMPFRHGVAIDGERSKPELIMIPPSPVACHYNSILFFFFAFYFKQNKPAVFPQLVYECLSARLQA